MSTQWTVVAVALLVGLGVGSVAWKAHHLQNRALVQEASNHGR